MNGNEISKQQNRLYFHFSPSFLWRVVCLGGLYADAAAIRSVPTVEQVLRCFDGHSSGLGVYILFILFAARILSFSLSHVQSKRVCESVCVLPKKCICLEMYSLLSMRINYRSK